MDGYFDEYLHAFLNKQNSDMYLQELTPPPVTIVVPRPSSPGTPEEGEVTDDDDTATYVVVHHADGRTEIVTKEEEDAITNTNIRTYKPEDGDDNGQPDAAERAENGEQSQEAEKGVKVDYVIATKMKPKPKGSKIVKRDEDGRVVNQGETTTAEDQTDDRETKTDEASMEPEVKTEKMTDPTETEVSVEEAEQVKVKEEPDVDAEVPEGQTATEEHNRSENNQDVKPAEEETGDTEDTGATQVKTEPPDKTSQEEDDKGNKIEALELEELAVEELEGEERIERNTSDLLQPPSDASLASHSKDSRDSLKKIRSGTKAKHKASTSVSKQTSGILFGKVYTESDILLEDPDAARADVPAESQPKQHPAEPKEETKPLKKPVGFFVQSSEDSEESTAASTPSDSKEARVTNDDDQVKALGSEQTKAAVTSQISKQDEKIDELSGNESGKLTKGVSKSTDQGKQGKGSPKKTKKRKIDDAKQVVPVREEAAVKKTEVHEENKKKETAEEAESSPKVVKKQTESGRAKDTPEPQKESLQRRRIKIKGAQKSDTAPKEDPVGDVRVVEKKNKEGVKAAIPRKVVVDRTTGSRMLKASLCEEEEEEELDYDYEETLETSPRIGRDGRESEDEKTDRRIMVLQTGSLIVRSKTESKHVSEAQSKQDTKAESKSKQGTRAESKSKQGTRAESKQVTKTEPKQVGKAESKQVVERPPKQREEPRSKKSLPEETIQSSRTDVSKSEKKSNTSQKPPLVQTSREKREKLPPEPNVSVKDNIKAEEERILRLREELRKREDELRKTAAAARLKAAGLLKEDLAAALVGKPAESGKKDAAKVDDAQPGTSRQSVGNESDDERRSGESDADSYSDESDRGRRSKKKAQSSSRSSGTSSESRDRSEDESDSDRDRKRKRSHRRSYSRSKESRSRRSRDSRSRSRYSKGSRSRSGHRGRMRSDDLDDDYDKHGKKRPKVESSVSRVSARKDSRGRWIPPDFPPNPRDFPPHFFDYPPPPEFFEQFGPMPYYFFPRGRGRSRGRFRGGHGRGMFPFPPSPRGRHYDKPYAHSSRDRPGDSYGRSRSADRSRTRSRSASYEKDKSHKRTKSYEYDSDRSYDRDQEDRSRSGSSRSKHDEKSARRDKQQSVSRGKEPVVERRFVKIESLERGAKSRERSRDRRGKSSAGTSGSQHASASKRSKSAASDEVKGRKVVRGSPKVSAKTPVKGKGKEIPGKKTVKRSGHRESGGTTGDEGKKKAEGVAILTESQMEILELEMRARAIKAMLQKAKDKEAKKQKKK